MIADVPQGSIFGRLLSLIYINDFPNSLQSNPNHFANSTYLFSTVHDINRSTISLKYNLSKNLEWEVQWNIEFEP